MGKGSTQTQTVTQREDPATARFRQSYRAAALAAQNRGINPYLEQAAGGFSDLAGNLGFGTQTGLGGVDAYFNPFQDEVVGAVQGDFDRQRQLASRAAADQATRAGAFGDSRSALLEAQALRDVNQLEGQTLAGIRSSGFNTAADRLLAERQRAGQFGLAGLSGLFGVGQQLDANQFAALQALIPGLQAGGSTSRQTTHQSGDFWSQLLGAGATIGGALIGGPAGAAAGGALAGGLTGVSDPSVGVGGRYSFI